MGNKQKSFFNFVLRIALALSQILSMLGTTIVGFTKPNLSEAAKLLPDAAQPAAQFAAQQAQALFGNVQMAQASTGQPNPVVSGNSTITLTKNVMNSSQSNYNVNITGPSYPSGATLPIVSGTQVITGLVNGVYTITEVSPGAGWVTTYTVGAVSNSTNAVITLTNAITATTFAATQITGRVYKDYNSDGNITANGVVTDTGVQSVTVTAYGVSGAVLGTTSTSSNGYYTFTPSANGPYRVEFTNLPAYYEPSRKANGNQNGSSVQFVNSAAEATNVNFAVLEPCDYCQNNPPVMTTLMVYGPPASNSSTPVIVGNYYQKRQNNQSADENDFVMANANQVGATFGLAYARDIKQLYVASFLKNLSGYGPGLVGAAGSSGAIYKIDMVTGAISVLIDLDASLANPAGSTGDNPHKNNQINFIRDPAWDKLGENGWGDIDISDDNKTLYAMNLYERALYAINVTTGNVISKHKIPGIAGGSAWTPATCTNNRNLDLKPFALKYRRGLVYVGMTCTAESTQNANDLRVYVYTFDPTTNSYSTNPIIDADVIESKRAWEPWFADRDTDHSSNIPWLSDIEFINDDIILNIRNAFMDVGRGQNGVPGATLGDPDPLNYGADTGVSVRSRSGGGDVWRVCKVGSNYVIEAAGVCGGVSGFSVDYFYENDVQHNNDFLGSSARLPGSNEFVSTIIPGTGRPGIGFISEDSKTYAPNNHTGLFDSSDDFNGDGTPDYYQKSNGTGDIEILCDPAPIEIGNRVWWDIDGDGIQDSGEPGLNGIPVTLTWTGGSIATTTSIGGNYYFTREATTGAYSTTLAANKAYTIEFGSPSGYSLTVVNAEGVATNHAISDVRDSDAYVISDIPTIYYTTGSAGMNNHGLDVGFTRPVKRDVTITNQAPLPTPTPTNTATPTPTATNTPVNTATSTATATATNTPTATPTNTATQTPTATNTPVNTATPTATATTTKTPTATPTNTATQTPTATNTPVNTATPTATATTTNTPTATPINTAISTPTATNTPVNTATSTATATATNTPTATPTNTATQTPTATNTPVNTATATSTPTATPTNTAISTPTATNTPVNTATPTDTPTAVPTATATATNMPTATPVNTATATATPTETQTATAIPTDTPTATATDTPTATPVNTATPTATATETPTNTPTATPVNTATPTATATETPTNTPTATATPTDTPTATPVNTATSTATATETPTNTPTATATPTDTPTATATATNTPTNTPTATPTDTPTATPTASATATSTPTSTPVKYSIGNLVWLDGGAGTNTNNGRVDAGEQSAGNGVTVELVNNGTGTILTTTTDSNGYYRFDNLDAGSYVVRLPTSNFASGGSLFGYESSTGQTATFTTTNNSYDHGDDTESDGVTSQKVTLGVSEPLNEVDGGASGNGTNGPSGDANDNLTADFGFYPVATFGNFVWIESDTDGIAATGVITPVVGKVITATDETGMVYTQTTNGAGYYTFTVPANHTYTVNYGAAPVGTVASSTPNDGTASNSDLGTDQQSRPNNVVVVLKPGDAIPTIDFGFNVPKLSLGNRLWVDEGAGANRNNGVRDSDEVAVPSGVTVVLVNNSTGTALTTTTDANGYYRFDGLDAGSYFVRIPASEFVAGGKLVGYSSSVGQTGTFTTTDNNRDHGDDGVTDGVTSQKVTLGVSEPLNEVDSGASGNALNGPTGDGKDNLTVDFGFVRQSFGNQVWIETDNDGVFEAGEVPVTGKVLTATSSIGVVYTTTTDVNGQYTFTVPAGVYTVTYGLPPTGTTPSVTPGGSTVNNASPDNQSHNNNTVVTLGAGEVIKAVDFGFVTKFSLGNRVWRDEGTGVGQTNNGIFDAGETPIANVVVELVNNNTSAAVMTTTTDANGYYIFNDVTAGSYVVRIPANQFAPSGTLTNSVSSVGQTGTFVALDNNRDHGDDNLSDGVTSQKVTLGVSEPLGEDTTSPGSLSGDAKDNLTVDFGFWRPASLGDYVWEDVNHNGQQDAGEPPIAGVLVSLQTPTGTITTTTSITGYYSFSNLVPNVPYTVTFATPPGYQQTLVNVGGDTADNDGLIVPVTLQPGQHNPTIDSGFWRPASLGDRVWLDVNNNGIQDAGEPGVVSVTVKLYSNGIVINTTQTDASGGYSFTNLISGTYTVTFMLPGGYIFTTPNAGGDEATDSDANVMSGGTEPYNIVSGGTEPRVDAGLFILPQLNVEKYVTTPDGNGSGAVVRPGDELVYTLIAKNMGSTVATGVVVTDPIDSPVVQYVAGSAVPAPTSSMGNTLVWEIGALNPGQTKEIVFRVRILDSLQASTVITNIAFISGRESGIMVTSRNSNIVDNPFEPSAVTLASFAALPIGSGVRVKWVTTSEIDTWSFALYRVEGQRSGEAVPDDAVKVTANAILGEGRGGGGGSYEFVDVDASTGKVYTYWLVETETTGRTNVYGPAKWGGANTSSGATKVYLPMLKKR